MKGDGRWFPFGAGELGLALAVIGFIVTLASQAGLEDHVLASATAAVVGLGYLAGLIVHNGQNPLRFHPYGGIGGAAYVRPFGRAKKSLLLVHVDDDPPNTELLRLYRTLLDAGVTIHRVVIVRPDGAKESYSWLAEFGTHENLRQRALIPDSSGLVRVSVAIVDGSTALLAVPSYEAGEGTPYTESMRLAHLLEIEDEAVAQAFVEIHSDAWSRGVEVDDPEVFRAPHELVEALERKRVSA